MYELILKGLGKRKVKSILNQWIKDQINRALENNNPIQFDHTIWLEEYNIKGFEDEPLDVDDLFKFIGNKI
jgi:hypothetical protein|tara:strand:- start:18 stop:230 length:213 start_codon:yes stop_codon:yes gene_type:complete